MLMKQSKTFVFLVWAFTLLSAVSSHLFFLNGPYSHEEMRLISDIFGILLCSIASILVLTERAVNASIKSERHKNKFLVPIWSAATIFFIAGLFLLY